MMEVFHDNNYWRNFLIEGETSFILDPKSFQWKIQNGNHLAKFFLQEVTKSLLFENCFVLLISLVLVSSKAVADSEFYEILDWSLSVLSKPKLQESLIHLLKSEGEMSSKFCNLALLIKFRVQSLSNEMLNDKMSVLSLIMLKLQGDKSVKTSISTVLSSCFLQSPSKITTELKAILQASIQDNSLQDIYAASIFSFLDTHSAADKFLLQHEKELLYEQLLQNSFFQGKLLDYFSSILQKTPILLENAENSQEMHEELQVYQIKYKFMLNLFNRDGIASLFQLKEFSSHFFPMLFQYSLTLFPLDIKILCLDFLLKNYLKIGMIHSIRSKLSHSVSLLLQKLSDNIIPLDLLVHNPELIQQQTESFLSNLSFSLVYYRHKYFITEGSNRIEYALNLPMFARKLLHYLQFSQISSINDSFDLFNKINIFSCNSTINSTISMDSFILSMQFQREFGDEDEMNRSRGIPEIHEIDVLQRFPLTLVQAFFGIRKMDDSNDIELKEFQSFSMEGLIELCLERLFLIVHLKWKMLYNDELSEKFFSLIAAIDCTIRLLLYVIAERTKKMKDSMIMEGLLPNQINFICSWIRDKLENLFEGFSTELFSHILTSYQSQALLFPSISSLSKEFIIPINFINLLPAYTFIQAMKNKHYSLLQNNYSKAIPSFLILLDSFRSHRNLLMNIETPESYDFFGKINSKLDLKFLFMSLLISLEEAGEGEGEREGAEELAKNYLISMKNISLPTYQQLSEYLYQLTNINYPNESLQEKLLSIQLILQSEEIPPEKNETTLVAHIKLFFLFIQLFSLQPDGIISLLSAHFLQSFLQKLLILHHRSDNHYHSTNNGRIVELLVPQFSAFLFQLFRKLHTEMFAFPINSDELTFLTSSNNNPQQQQQQQQTNNLMKKKSAGKDINYNLDNYSLTFFHYLYQKNQNQFDQLILLKLQQFETEFSIPLSYTTKLITRFFTIHSNPSLKSHFRKMKMNNLSYPNDSFYEEYSFLHLFNIWMTELITPPAPQLSSDYCTGASKSNIVSGIALWTHEIFSIIQKMKESDEKLQQMLVLVASPMSIKKRRLVYDDDEDENRYPHDDEEELTEEEINQIQLDRIMKEMKILQNQSIQSFLFPFLREETLSLLFPLLIHYLPTFFLSSLASKSSLQDAKESAEGLSFSSFSLETFQMQRVSNGEIVILEFINGMLWHKEFAYFGMLILWIFNRINSMLCDYFELIQQIQQETEESRKSFLSSAAAAADPSMNFSFSQKNPKMMGIISILHANTAAMFSLVLALVEVLSVGIEQIFPSDEKQWKLISSAAEYSNAINVSHLIWTIIIVLQRFVQLYTNIYTETSSTSPLKNKRKKNPENSIGSPVSQGSANSATNGHQSEIARLKLLEKKLQAVNNQLLDHFHRQRDSLMAENVESSSRSSSPANHVQQRRAEYLWKRNADFLYFLEKYFQTKAFPSILIDDRMIPFLQEQATFFHSLPGSQSFLLSFFRSIGKEIDRDNHDQAEEEGDHEENVEELLENEECAAYLSRSMSSLNQSIQQHRYLFQRENGLESGLSVDIRYLQGK